jgi:hypothetical protein
MRQRRITRVMLLWRTLTTLISAQTFTTLASFDASNGQAPGGVIQGADGNFYGSTATSGAYYGTLFKIRPSCPLMQPAALSR